MQVVPNTTQAPKEEAVGAEQSAPVADGPKQGSKCCGFCCDYRRAVIIVSTVWSLLHLVLIILIASDAISGETIGDVDSVDKDAWEEHVEDYQTAQIILSVLWIVFGAGAVVGALKYNFWLVGLYPLYLVVCFITDVTLMVNTCNDFEGIGKQCKVSGIPIIIEVIFVAINIYPSIGFIVEVRKGIMSKETYPREEYSCLCVG